jgi:hypothetical protein
MDQECCRRLYTRLKLNGRGICWYDAVILKEGDYQGRMGEEAQRGQNSERRYEQAGDEFFGHRRLCRGS